MKIKQIIIAGALFVSAASFAQKDELKALKKIYSKEVPKAEEISEYKSAVEKLQSLVVEEGDKVYANFYKYMTPIVEANAIDKTLPPLQIEMQMGKVISPKIISDLATAVNATLDYEAKAGVKKVFTEDIATKVTSFKPQFLNYAIKLGNEKKYKESSEVLYSIYQLDKKDLETLYYAANYATNGHDYDKALVYYKDLIAQKYTGEGTTYFAKNKISGAEESYANKSDRDGLVRLGTHILPRDEKIPSKKGEIIRNIALILVEQGKTEEAKVALQEARKENPDDAGLIVSEANIYLNLKDAVNYKRLITEALEKNPNDEVLIFNLGVTCANANQLEDAEKYYRKAIELKPDFMNAYLNLADLVLKPDAKIVEEMNKIKGTSDSEMKKYNVLKEQRQKMFYKAMPLYEKAHELDPKDDLVKGNLKSVYNYLELTDKAKALKSE
jgi:tetratricopeptide (TPR) repeat protein